MTPDDDRRRPPPGEGNGQGTRAHATQGKKLLDRTWDRLLDAGIQAPAARRYVRWMRGFILFHQKRHPRNRGMPEIEQYLQPSRFHYASGSQQRAEAQRALKFLYENVLERVWPGENRPRNKDHAPSGTKRAVYLHGQRLGVKLMDRVRKALRVGQYALETEKSLPPLGALTLTCREFSVFRTGTSMRARFRSSTIPIKARQPSPLTCPCRGIPRPCLDRERRPSWKQIFTRSIYPDATLYWPMHPIDSRGPPPFPLDG